MKFKRETPLFLNKSAFSIAEVLTATALMLLASAGVLSLYIIALNINDVETIRSKELSEGALIMGKILRGVGGNGGLREAVSFEPVTDSSSITYTTVNGEQRSFYLSSNKIYFGPSNTVIGDDVSALNFTAIKDYVDISITFLKTHRGKTLSYNFSESVWPRNSIRSGE